MSLIRPKAVFHLFAWLCLFALLANLLHRALPLPKAAIGSLIATLALTAVAYANMLLAIPRFFKKGKFGWYALAVLGLLAFSMVLNLSLLQFLRSDETLYALPGRWGVLPVFFISLATLFISTVVALARQFLEKEHRLTHFENAMETMQEQLDTKPAASPIDVMLSFENQFIIIKQGHDHHKIFLKDIRYVAALREYSQYHTRQGRFMELKAISKVAEALPSEQFMQINRSYIVAKSAVNGQEGGSLLLSGGERLPIGKTYRLAVKGWFFE